MHFLLYVSLLQVCVALPTLKGHHDFKPKPGKDHGFGRQTTPDDTKIANGQPAYRGQFPYQAALILDEKAFCSGSLISKTWLLSAAHCVVSFSTVSVYLGTILLDPVDSSCVVTSSRLVVIHEEFNKQVFKNDISLIHLVDEIPFSYYIQHLYLPGYSDQNNSFVEQAVLLSGWGETDTDDSESPLSIDSKMLSNELRYIETYVVSNSVCESVYGSSVITSSTICASGTGGIGPCNGDSGGALVINNDGYYTQVGVALFNGGTSCSDEYPSGYTRVTSYLDWISNITGIMIPEFCNITQQPPVYEHT